MTDQIPGLMGFVVRELKENPDMKSGALYEKALKRYPAAEEMSVRQFHARYPLQAKRQLAKDRSFVPRFPPRKAEPSPEAQAQPSAAGAGASAPPAPARRPTSLAAAARPEPDEPKMPPREAIRLLLFRLAMDLETARTRADLVDVIARLDRYVDEAMAIGRA